MPKGGKRQGAGRKPGIQNQINREMKEKLLAEGITPLEHMLNVMRNEAEDAARRDEMAKAAAPYVHSKMPQDVMLGGKEGAPLVVIKDFTRDKK